MTAKKAQMHISDARTMESRNPEVESELHSMLTNEALPRGILSSYAGMFDHA